MEENQKMGPRNLPKNVDIEVRADVERPISHFVFIGLLPYKLIGGVRPTSQTPYPLYDQNLRCLLPYL